jgi:hypothetical protein
MTTVAERVAAGAAWLDQREPGWHDRINLSRLRMQSGCCCILGQLRSDLSGNWSQLLAAFGLELAFDGTGGDPEVDLGFDRVPFSGEPDTEWADLEAEWRRVIGQRRAGQ